MNPKNRTYAFAHSFIFYHSKGMTSKMIYIHISYLKSCSEILLCTKTATNCFRWLLFSKYIRMIFFFKSDASFLLLLPIASLICHTEAPTRSLSFISQTAIPNRPQLVYSWCTKPLFFLWHPWFYWPSGLLQNIAVAHEKYTNHNNQSFLTDLFCPVLPRFTAIFCRHTGDSFCHENRPKLQNPAKWGKSGTWTVVKS